MNTSSLIGILIFLGELFGLQVRPKHAAVSRAARILSALGFRQSAKMTKHQPFRYLIIFCHVNFFGKERKFVPLF